MDDNVAKESAELHAAALSYRFRAMRSEDISQVLDIERASFPSMWPRTVYQRALKNRLARYFVAFEPPDPAQPARVHGAGFDGLPRMVRSFLGSQAWRTPPREHVAGVAGLWLMMGEGHIVTISVRPELRRRGIGELLLVASIDAAIDAGQDEVTLECRVSNMAALAMYEKYGFMKVGVRARYYSDTGEDAMLMATPPLRSSTYRRLLADRVADQRERWSGLDVPFQRRLGDLAGSSP